MGAVLKATSAFRCATTPVDAGRPWLSPDYVLGAAYDGKRGYFVARNDLIPFLTVHEAVPLILHDAASGLDVLHRAAPEIDVYRRVDVDAVWDTMLLHRLFTLATEGHTASGEGESTLERCAELYLDVVLPEHAEDSRGDAIPLAFGRWLGRPFRDIEPAYRDYLAADVVVTWQLYRRLRRRIERCLADAAGAWGFVSAEWLRDQVRRWGPLTHHIQLKAAIVLKAITAAGLPLDLRRRDALLAQVEAIIANTRAVLQDAGYSVGMRDADASLQAILGRLERHHPDRALRRTSTGLIATTEEALAPLARAEPFVATLLAYRAAETLKTTVLGKMDKQVLHPSFDVLKVTGRTSSSGDVNAQNLPIDERVRSLVVPPAGHVWINADYSAIEMVALAQALTSQFGLRSRLAVALNDGRDPHRMVAALAAGTDEAKVTLEEREKGKPINFGKPVGMGHDGLKVYARAGYDVDLTDDEVEELSDAWFTLFPEMREFRKDPLDLGVEVAAFFGLTPTSYEASTGSRKFTAHPANAGREDRPSGALGGMFLKVLKQPEPRTLQGRPYDDEEIAYFWSQVEEKPAFLPARLHDAVRRRRPSPELQKTVMGLVGRARVFTLTGRLRANATYTARHNTIFQGLAADGAKLALWRLWRAGYAIHNFVHDEVLIAVPEDSDLGRHARKIRGHMIKGMKEVIPEVRVGVKFVASTVWSKGAEKLTDEEGRLLAWRPREDGPSSRPNADSRASRLGPPSRSTPKQRRRRS